MTQEDKLIKVDRNSIMFKFWKYFSGFAAIILIALWLLQIVFLNNFYESMKIREVTKIGNYLRSEYNSPDFEYQILNYSQKKGMNIEVIDEEGHLIYPFNWVEALFKPKVMDEQTFNEFFSSIINGKEKYRVFVVKFPNLENPTLVYAGYLGLTDDVKYYITIKTSLDPVDSTIDILKKMLIIVSILSLGVSVVLSYFMSKRLSKPLVDMSKTAKKLGSGNYDISFRKGDYTEIDDLADTLNYATTELTKTIEMRKDLIANVSHDLKTPLTVIKSYGEMIRDISGNNEEKRNEHIETIIRESDNLTTLVNDLLDLSKMESNLEEINFIPVDLKNTTAKIVNRFEFQKEKDGYVFNLDFKGDCIVLGDEKKLEQVIYNLINNAINYSKAEKIITIKIEEKDNKVRFDCIDKGIGIKEDELEDIWERFYRVRDNHTRPSVGTGLGLYIVKNILELHNFEYGVNSQLGKGSDFYFIADTVK
ncbi:sensor histidine kinase [Peptoniphilus stercorisuis]|uniref:histidine kinase n=1 Tax=Peptoniphilus stercorisuis TaxID=1436965 RepID=A0ABS4KDH2_9FIRM|nr:signal transduction histidine kinase [Peptoniphilus stercorisuis]